jgi:hypothetical protein
MCSPDSGPPLISVQVGGREDGVRVVGVEPDLGDPGVVRDVEYAFPSGAAIAGAVETAVAARSPQRTLGRDPDHIGISGIDDDVADVLALLEPHVGPGRAAIDALVDAVAE